MAKMNLSSLIGGNGIDVDDSGKNWIISNRGVGVDDGFGGGATTTVDPFAGKLGFYAYSTGTDVIISAGQVLVRTPSDQAGAFASLDSGIPQTTVSGLVPGQSGYVVFKYAQSLSGYIENSTAQDAPVDFGDPSQDYLVQFSTGYQPTNQESNTVNGQRYGFIFSLDVPHPSKQFFQCIICEVDVATDGRTTVRPVHIGSIDVPIGYIGNISDFLVDGVG